MMNINRHGSEKTCIFSDEQNGIDRISSLPDDVRTHILSFLTTREAMQTCVLSKRWINIWAFVLDLEFNIEEFGLPKNFNDRMAVEFVTKFKLLVKSALEKRETSCVNRFRLWLNSGIYWPCTQAFVDCIGDVIKLGPRECLVEMTLCEDWRLNTNLIFTCASLIKIQLYLHIVDNCVVDITPNSVNLPCLKTLHLDGVAINDNSLKKLLLGCSMLEELVLEKCYMDTIEIYSKTLKKLVLWIEYGYKVDRLQISTPNLLYLDINIISMGEIMLLNLPSVVDAFIYIGYWYDQDNYVTSVPKLIHSLSNVESLRLHGLDLYFSWGEVLKKDFYDCPVFNNLKHLKLLDWHLDDFDLAPFFLHSPKLHELTLEYKHY
ncbi:F-box/LRR-repeat protein At4g14103-like isoform X2 [Carex rostrata]